MYQSGRIDGDSEYYAVNHGSDIKKLTLTTSFIQALLTQETGCHNKKMIMLGTCVAAAANHIFYFLLI